MYSTRVSRRIAAPRAAVYRALTDVDGGTEILIVHDGIPDSVPPADNETGTRMALDNLARLVESGDGPGDGTAAGAGGRPG